MKKTLIIGSLFLMACGSHNSKVKVGSGSTDMGNKTPFCYVCIAPIVNTVAETDLGTMNTPPVVTIDMSVIVVEGADLGVCPDLADSDKKQCDGKCDNESESGEDHEAPNAR